jgi:hypothetical protein
MQVAIGSQSLGGVLGLARRPDSNSVTLRLPAPPVLRDGTAALLLRPVTLEPTPATSRAFRLLRKNDFDLAHEHTRSLMSFSRGSLAYGGHGAGSSIFAVYPVVPTKP